MSDKKILVTGANGFVGRTLVPYLQSRGYEVVGVDMIAGSPETVVCNVADVEQFSAVLKQAKPDVIVHCAARKNLPDCEEHKQATFESNTLSTETIAAYARQNDAKVVYISSDVVFDGQRGDYGPDDSMRPINWYGKTKAFSEIVLRSFDNVAICRTALIIGKLNEDYRELLRAEVGAETLVNQTLLPQYVYQRLQSGRQLRMPATIISNPTPVELLCKIIYEVIAQDSRGVFHATGPDALSRYDTGRLIAELFGFDPALVVRDDDNISALRPRNISMDSSNTFRRLGIIADEWSLATYLKSEALYD